jgi:8-oxo-dGTP diphosphatase
MTEVRFYDPLFEPDKPVTYSLISARYREMWIIVRHQYSTTWEIPGGHIEPGETSHETACRELMEETGASSFNMECVATYSVIKNEIPGFGRLYLAEVSELGPVPDVSEIAEVMMVDQLPENLTYPDIQPFLFRKSLEYYENRNSEKNI